MSFATFSDSYIRQIFSFRESLIYYISLESVESLKKLLLTCKYFYLKYRIIPCDVSTKQWGFHENKGEGLIAQNDHKVHPKNVWLCGGKYYLNPPKISELVTKIYRSDIAEMCSKKLKTIFIHDVAILYPDKSMVPVEIILEALPYVDDFHFLVWDPYVEKSCGFTTESAQKLSKIERFVKFVEFRIYDVPANFHLPSFCQFVKKHVSPDGIIRVHFQKETENAILTEFKNALNSLVRVLEIEKYL
uniref:F-box domain-containing protein n=1 Tax=Panagrolaimus superbus TaxID=310955 RepID=A0A914Z3C7_9BILA